jgi:OHCU decarboxylase
VRELPRQLSADELAELFEGRTRFVERLAREEDPLVRARTLVHELPYEEKVEILARLNAAYEERHGFRFVVFVNRRPKSEILDLLRVRITNPTDQELETALSELVAIADDRWRRR